MLSTWVFVHWVHLDILACVVVQAAKGIASITSYYSQQKKPASTAAVPTKHIADTAEQIREARPPRGLASASAGGLASASAAMDPRQTVAVGKAAGQPEDDSWNSGSRLATAALPQPEVNSSMPSRSLAQPHADTSSVGLRRQLSHSNSCDDLLLQSPYAMRLRVQEKNAATHKSGVTLPYQTGSDHEAEEEAGGTNHAAAQHLDCHPSTFADSSSEGEQRQGNAAARRPGHWLAKEHLSHSPGHLPKSPHAEAAPAELFTSPKRTARSYQEESIVISPSSESQEDLEICLLSPSPAKRYATNQLGLTLVEAVFLGRPCCVICGFIEQLATLSALFA